MCSWDPGVNVVVTRDPASAACTPESQVPRGHGIWGCRALPRPARGAGNPATGHFAFLFLKLLPLNCILFRPHHTYNHPCQHLSLICVQVWRPTLLLLFTHPVVSDSCNPTDCSTPGFPALHYLLEFAQIHVHWGQWCHPTLSSSVIPFLCPQSLPTSGSSPMSQFFASGGQSVGASASASTLPVDQFSSVQSLSWIRLFAAPWTAASQTSLSITNIFRVDFL